MKSLIQEIENESARGGRAKVVSSFSSSNGGERGDALLPTKRVRKSQTVGVFIRLFKGDKPGLEYYGPEIFRLCKEGGIPLTDDLKYWYRCDGVSAKKAWTEPAFLKMLADIENGEISGIVVPCVSGLGWASYQILNLYNFINQHGAYIVSLKENIDTRTTEGKNMLLLFGLQADRERRMARRRRD